jgi:hypothetical protein
VCSDQMENCSSSLRTTRNRSDTSTPHIFGGQ